MRDLSLGPQTEAVLRRFRGPTAHNPIGQLAEEMADLLVKWLNVAWCYVDSCPASICGGPHVLVRYTDGIEVIEQANKIGQTFKDVDYTRVTPDPGAILRDAAGDLIKRGDRISPAQHEFGGTDRSGPPLHRKGVRSSAGPCPCECNSGGFCGGCGHTGCGARLRPDDQASYRRA